MNIYVAPKPPTGGSKTHNGRFPSKIEVHFKKVCYRVSLNTVSDKVVMHTACLSVQKWFAGDVPYYVKIWLKLTNPLKNADF